MTKPNPITRHLVPDSQRMSVAEKHFGLNYVLHFEPTVFRMTEALTSNYSGGYWNFYTLNNHGFYMALASDASYEVACDNGFSGSVSAETLGIIVCLYAYSQLSFQDGQFAQSCGNQYHLLREFALGRSDENVILAAID